MFARWIYEYKKRRALAKWERRGRPAPLPGAAKRMLIREIAQRHRPAVFVETGTYKGDTVYEVESLFERVISIELSPKKVFRARKRFAREAKVEILEGDSGVVLLQVLSNLKQRALFWLDVHFTERLAGSASSPFPIIAEVEALLSHPIRDHVILIDDARMFTGNNAYPRLEELGEMVLKQRPDLEMVVDQDIIRLTPRS